MIDAKELKIGNMVMFMGREIYVHGGTIQDLERDNASQSQYQPIPLTTEILEKCGFTLEENKVRYGIGFSTGSEWILFSLMEHIHGHWVIISTHFENKETGINTGTVKHLHQLQNLYYALTYSELIIEL